MIRPAAPKDAKEIAALWNWMINETLATFTTEQKTEQGVVELIEARPGLFLVTVRDGALAGFATCGAFRPGPGYAATVEHSVIVSPQAHGAGHGRALLTALEARARDYGKHVMLAAISGANPAAVAFHAALGYTEVGRLPEVGCKAGRWLDLVLMQKTLSPDR
ncbi:MAG: N-acetyltransferase family protein [Pseudomonadota bacterium]